MTPESIRSLFQYNYVTHRRLWDAIMKLDDAQFLEKVDYSLGSIRNHMVHLVSVDARWLARIKEEAPPERLNMEDFNDRASVRAKYDEVEKAVLDFAEQVDQTTLDKVLLFSLPDRGGEKVNAVWQIMIHMVIHGVDHRAQVLPILEKMGAPTFEQDYMLYLWE